MQLYRFHKCYPTTLTDGASVFRGAITGVTTMVTSGDVTVGGNLTVSGTTTQVNSNNTTISDTLVVLTVRSNRC